jgi:DNA modification methylase
MERTLSQTFKSVYFPDHPGESASQRNLKLAFGAGDSDLYQVVKPLSGQQVREVIGYSSYALLQQAASDEHLATNTFCLRTLRQRIALSGESQQQNGLPGLEDTIGLPFDPLQATFRGGKAEPLHEWYPYLQAYSPDFVAQILFDFAPAAQHILDPFAGMGTTPLTICGLDRRASYCEVNPLLQFLIAAKTLASSAHEKMRGRIAESIEQLSEQLSGLVPKATRDAALATTYSRAFGSSRFFDDAVFDQILSLRTVLDGLACEQADVAQLATVAVVASLVASSRLIRRGDLRYKTEQESRRCRTDLLQAICERLAAMAQDLRRLRPITAAPRCVCEDARNLVKLPQLDIDAVITSPPYLNGTNYFRNTKVELWFLRCLTSPDDLAGYRYRAVTAGINDVTVQKPVAITTEAVEKVVMQLEESAYDPRIPLMVKTYFHDMAVIFDGIIPHLRKNATLIIDIGDSAYGGVHVPTHLLLMELLAEKGFALEREVTLRKRLSRGGIPLSQSLIVLRRTLPRSKRKASNADRFQVAAYMAWQEFKKTLPHQQGEFAKRNWGHPLHSLCSYQGKMKPSLASHLVRTFVPVGGRMLDPFGGVGTIAFEAALQGKQAWSFDISSAAAHIAAAKVGGLDGEVVNAAMARLKAHLQANRPDPNDMRAIQGIRINGPLSNYFHPRTLSEIVVARRYFMDNPPQSPSESLVFAALLHILHGNRPYSLSRRSHPITPFSPTGETKYRALMPRLQDKVARSLNTRLPANFVPGLSLFQDATGWWPQDVANLDAVITSPPFFDSTRFYLANWMRLWFAGWTAEDFHRRPLAFVDERQKKAFSVYEPIFRQARERLKPGGVMLLHLGKSRKCDMAASLAGVAKPWFHVVDVFSEDVGHCESHGISDKGAVVQHAYMLLN